MKILQQMVRVGYFRLRVNLPFEVADAVGFQSGDDVGWVVCKDGAGNPYLKLKKVEKS